MKISKLAMYFKFIFFVGKDIIKKISDYFQTQPIEKAWLFGSFTRGEQSEESDIDILVNFSNNSKMSLLKYANIINNLEKITGRKVDLVEEGQLKPFAKKNVDRERVLIYKK
jgi:predicted nucleotidyltransferase